MRRIMTVSLALPALAAFALVTSGCIFGGDDDEEPTATPALPTATPTTAADESPTIAPTATTPAEETATPGDDARPTEYTVQPGDYLSVIAAKFGLTVEELADANGIEDPDKIFVGQVLVIPPASE